MSENNFKQEMKEFRNNDDYKGVVLLGNAEESVRVSVQGRFGIGDIPHMFGALADSFAKDFDEDPELISILALKGVQKFLQRRGVDDGRAE